MPPFVQKIDVSSPLIMYSGPWELGGADGDPKTFKYDQGTYRYCGGTQCSAALNFTGTEVHVVGAYRLNSGPFSVLLDDVVFGPFGTETTVTEQFQIALFNQTNMAPGAHSLTISNLAAPDPKHPTLDLHLDYFTWKTETNSLDDVRIQDNTPAFSYQPPNGWVSDLSNLNLPGFEVGTGHGTTKSGATATLNFMGDRVALYGPISVSGGNYSVQVDNTSYVGFTSHRLNLGVNSLANQMLFYADSLPAGNHTVTVTTGSLSAQAVVLSYAVVDGNLNSVPASTASPALASSTTATSRTTLSSAELAAVICSTILFTLACIIFGVYLLHRRRRAHEDTLEEAAPSIAQSHVVPAPNRGVAMQAVPFTLTHGPPPGLKESQMMQDSLPAYEPDRW
ncbi:hypothetical protein C8J57DRAFT_1716979 [Mycena rebaudengoi]|nr:hypothetical protein C8J57DRAFT_1716979 [Mycena rebaudengoi]